MKYSLCTVILTTYFVFVNVDSTLAQNVVQRPTKYQMPGEEGDLSPSPHGERIPLQPWIVFSDRFGNETYTLAGGGSEQSTAEYLDRFVVIDEREEYVKLARGNEVVPRGLQLSSGSKIVGWIHKGNLLLWNHCLISPSYRLPRRVVVVSAVGSDNRPSGIGPSNRRAWLGPGYGYGRTLEEARLLELLFVLKTEQGWALLARAPSFDPAQSLDEIRSTIVGWLPREQLVYLTQRVVLEPILEASQVSLTVNRKNPIIFRTSAAAKRYAEESDNVPSEILLSPSRDPVTRRIPRFIILRRHSTDPNLYSIGVLATGGQLQPELAENFLHRPIVLSGPLNQGGVTVHEGFVALESSYAKQRLFRRMIILTREELAAVVNFVQKLKDAGMNRTSLYEAWKAEIDRRLNAQAVLPNNPLSFQQMNELVFGLPGLNDAFSGLALDDIPNRTRFSDEKFGLYNGALDNKLRTLREILNKTERDVEWFARVGNLPIYFVPEDLLP